MRSMMERCIARPGPPETIFGGTQSGKDMHVGQARAERGQGDLRNAVDRARAQRGRGDLSEPSGVARCTLLELLASDFTQNVQFVCVARVAHGRGSLRIR
jgi:hypothetical protein